MQCAFLTGRTLLARETSGHRVPSGCGAIDATLRGGLRRGALTELHGASGGGKTQLCLQATAANGRAGAVYVSTEGPFPVQRLREMLRNSPHHDPNVDSGARIFVEHLTEAEELDQCVRVRLPALLTRHRADLLVLDSVAAPFRVAYTNYAERARRMRELGVSLLRLAREHDLAVLCVNQVSASISSDAESLLVPSLGLTWSNMVSTRLSVARTPASVDCPRDPPGLREHCAISATCAPVVRSLKVVFAPDLPHSEVPFVVTEKGIEAVY